MSIRELIDIDELKSAQNIINATTIPSPPQLLIDLNSEFALEKPDTGKIVKWIGEDVALAARVIKTINMPFYGLNSQVNSIEHAISLFGVEKLKNLIIQPAYKLAMDKAFKGYENISEHCHQVGTIAEIIGQEYDHSLTGLCYMTGLFHDVGSLFLAASYSDYMDFMKTYPEGSITQTLFEREKYGVSHATVGVLLAKHWGLPNEVCNAIYLHHTVIATYHKKVDTTSNTLAAIIQMAEHFLLNPQEEKTAEEFSQDPITICYESAIEELMIDETMLTNIKLEVNKVIPIFSIIK
jgi:HD-like signal output (HDOD) protein